MNSLKFIRKKQPANKSPTSIKSLLLLHRFIIPFLVLFIGLVISYFNWDVTSKSRENELRSYFEYRARDINTHIIQRIIGYEQILRSARGLYNASANVNRAEFRSFVNSLRLEKNFQNFQGVGYPLIIQPAQIKKHVAAIREEDFPEYRIWPEGKRETYTSIIYLKLFKNLNLRVFGNNLFSEPVRCKVMETVRDANGINLDGHEWSVLINSTPQLESRMVNSTVSIIVFVGLSLSLLLTIISWLILNNRKQTIKTNAERENVLAQLTEEIKRRQIIFEQSTDGIVVIDPRTARFIEFNTAAHRQLGYTREEFAVLINADVETKETYKKAKSTMARVMKEGRVDFETLQKTKSGEIRNILVTAQNIDNSGRPVYHCLWRDITEQKLAENKLRESELRFEQITESAGELIWEVDTDGVYTYVNPIVKELLGYNPDELIGIKHFYDFFEPEHREELKQGALAAIVRKEKIKSFINCCIHKDGRKVFFSTCGFPMLDEKNNLIGYRGVDVDITEYKHFLESLKNNEQKFMALAEQSPNLIFINYNGRYVYVNKKCVDALGYSKEEFYSDDFDFFNLVAEEYKELTRQNKYKLLQGIAIEPHDYALISKNGKRMEVILSIELIDYAGDKQFMGTAMDITERKHAEAGLSESERKTRALLDAIPDLIFRIDRDGTYLDYKADRSDLYAQSEQTIIGKKNRDITPPEFADLIDRYIGQTLESGELQEFEYQMIIPMHGLRDYEARMVPSGKDEVITFVRNITDRKRAEEGLKISEIKFRNIVEGTRAILFSVNKRGIFTYLNEAACYKLGMNLQDILGKFYLRFVHIESRSITHSTFSEQIVNPTPNISIDVRLMPKSGNNTWLNLLVNPIYKDGIIEGLSAVGLDITDRKEVEAGIKVKNEQLVKLNSEKDKFFSIIAHDLRSPFNGLLNLTELMSDSRENFSPAEFADYSKLLNESARILYKLLENLLEWAQVQKGSIDFTPIDLYLSKIVSQNIDIIYQRALQKRIKILNEIDNTQRVFADEKMIDTVFRNLLSNAVKFTKIDGKVVVKSERSNNGTIEVSVEDNGVGINEKDIIRLFKLEEKVSSVGTEGEPSTGLGLLLCKEFIEMHGGKIWVESKEGKGSKFIFTLRKSILNSTQAVT